MTEGPQQIRVGMRLEQYPPKYYAGFPCSSYDGDYDSVRGLLEARLEMMEHRVRMLRAVLETRDPEHAESALCDGPNLQVCEVILRPRAGLAALEALVEHRFLPRMP